MTELIRGRYERLGVLGSGSQGEVLLCLDHQHGRKVAIKSRRVRSREDRDRVLEEARVLLTMRPHPNVALVRDDFFEGASFYMVMDWIEGRSLAAALVEHEALAFEDVVRWLGQIATALDHLHDHEPSIVHQDVKPANIVLNAAGDAVLVDFGVARALGGTAAEGTPAYSAPEVLAGHPPSPASDIYSLAVTAFELLTRSLPDLEMRPAAAALAPHLPSHVRRALGVSLSDDPSSRASNAREFVSSLGNSPLPLPPMLELESSSFFAGREAEVAAARDVWAEVRESSSRLVLVAGEPGIGKTRLVSELARSFHDEGAIVLFGRTDPEPLAPFQPFVEALSHYVEHCPAAKLRGEVPKAAGELTLLLPELDERLPELTPVAGKDPEMRRYRLFDAVASLLVAIAASSPLVVVLDDLHWADRSTLALLDHLLRRSGGVPILVVGAFRDAEVSAGHPLHDILSTYRSGRDLLQLTLAGLTPDEVANVLADETGSRAPAAVVRDISEGTRGNPLFVHEMSRHLVEARAVTAGGIWGSVDLEQLGVPKGIGAMIETRVARLPAERRVLDVAAVSGREFELAVVERVVGGDPLPAIEEAIRARLVEEERGALGRFSFSHALFRQSLYEQLTPTRRIRTHELLARAIEDMTGSEPGSRLGDLAHHSYMAARGGDADAARRGLPHSLRAGEDASARAAFEESVSHYWRTHELMTASGTGDDERIDVLLKIAADGSRVGLWADARRAGHAAADLARASGSTQALVRCALSLMGGVFVDPIEVRKQDIALLDEALAILPVEDSSVRARLLARRAWMKFSDPRTPPEGWAEIKAWADEALAIARRLDDDATTLYVMHSYVSVHMDPAFSRELDRMSERVIELAIESGSADFRGHALLIRSVILVKLGRLADTEDSIEELEALGRFDPMLGWFGTGSRLSVAILRGDLAEAERVAALGQQQLQRARSQTLTFIQFCLLYELRRLQGRIDELLPMLDGVVRAAPGVAFVRCLLAAALADMDRLALAREHFEVLAADGLPQGRSLISGRNSLSYLATVCFALGDTDRAHLLYDLLLPHEGIHLSDGRPIAGSRGYGAHYLGMLAGMLGRNDAAEAHFERALALHEAMGSPPWIAETKLRYAEMLAQRDRPGDRVRAAAALAEARAIAEGIDAAGLVSAIGALEGRLAPL